MILWPFLFDIINTMLTPKQIDELKEKLWLGPHELAKVFFTLQELQRINEDQAQLLTQALNQLDAYRQRVDFYRSATTKLIG